MQKLMEKQINVPGSASALTATVYPILLMISFSHLLNDTIQSLIPAIYPIVKTNFHLNFSQIGLITLTFQLAASLLQPLVGMYTDRRPKPFSLATSMVFTLIGLISMSQAGNFHVLLISVAMIGIGSSIFHPEASKVAYMASGGKRGLAQSIFQVGGNAGSSLGPLLAALIIVPLGQSSIGWFSILPLIALMVLIFVGRWYKLNLNAFKKIIQKTDKDSQHISKRKVFFSIMILIVLIFSKYFYLASMVSYLTFYMIEKFHVSVQHAQ
ncbi:MAG TPA: MFS transporter, partial [Puia sp.]|nr:MFS transporter [Puia sp.]